MSSPVSFTIQLSGTQTTPCTSIITLHWYQKTLTIFSPALSFPLSSVFGLCLPPPPSGNSFTISFQPIPPVPRGSKLPFLAFTANQSGCIDLNEFASFLGRSEDKVKYSGCQVPEQRSFRFAAARVFRPTHSFLEQEEHFPGRSLLRTVRARRRCEVTELHAEWHTLQVLGLQ